jgi:hypothetical protein
MDKPRVVFISHSFSDENWVREFANSLQQRGLNVWFDSPSIPLGQPWTEAIEKGLRESNCAAGYAGQSKAAEPFFEIGAAMGMGK